MSPDRAARLYVAIAGDLVLYGVSCVVASAATVMVFTVASGLNGVGSGFGAVPVLIVFGVMTTFIYAMPASAILIGIGEWRGYGRFYYTLAGVVSALLSFVVLVGASPIREFPRLEFLAIAVGGLAGGAVFGRMREMLGRHF